MRTRKGFLGAVCALTATGLATGSVGASMNDVPQSLQKSAQCMLTVLKQTPGVAQISLGVVNSAGWVHPYLEYLSAPNAYGERITIRFEAEKSRKEPGTYTFKTKLKNVLVQGESGPNFWGTGPLTTKWQSDCKIGTHVDW